MSRVSRVLTLGPLALALVFAPGLSALADEKDAVPKAQSAAAAWLALTDGGKYAQSWEAASTLFKAGVAKAEWEKAARSVRAPLGPLKSRTVRSATFTRTLPGAPDGEYVVIQFDSQFGNKAAAVETITPTLEKDGAWRVSGYFIR